VSNTLTIPSSFEEFKAALYATGKDTVQVFTNPYSLVTVSVELEVNDDDLDLYGLRYSGWAGSRVFYRLELLYTELMQLITTP
jgi:hypothetical protein